MKWTAYDSETQINPVGVCMSVSEKEVKSQTVCLYNCCVIPLE